MQGRALDLDTDVFGSCTNAQIFDYIRKNLEFDQLFGSSVLKIILTGFMCLSFVMALIVVGASKLAVTIKERFFTK